MKRKRLTREQSKDLTRQRLLEAAQAIFTKKGYVASSVEDIAAGAGYTRGAFYSNFRSKAELLLELLHRDHARLMTELNAIIEEQTTPEQMQARAVAYYSAQFRADECFLLWAEARLLAVRDARFRTRFNTFAREKREQLAAYSRAFSERIGTPLPLPGEALALGLICLCDGVQFFRMCDPQQVSDETAQAVLAGFFSRVLFGSR